MAHFNFFLKYETGDVFLDEIEAHEYKVSSRNSCHPPAPSSSSGASSNLQRTTSHVAGHPPAPSSSSGVSSNSQRTASAPSSSSGVSSNSQRTTSHVSGHPPAPSSSSGGSSNSRFISRAARHSSASGASVLNSAYCQRSRSLDDMSEEYKCCKGECLANLGTPSEIAEFKAGALKKLNAVDVKVNSLLF